MILNEMTGNPTEEQLAEFIFHGFCTGKGWKLIEKIHLYVFETGIEFSCSKRKR